MSDGKIPSVLEEMADDPAFQLAMAEEDLIHRVALRVSQYRKANGISQPGLADLIDTKQPRIATLEAGNANVTLRTLARVAYALKCDPEDLVAEKEPGIARAPVVTKHDVQEQFVSRWKQVVAASRAAKFEMIIRSDVAAKPEPTSQNESAQQDAPNSRLARIA